MLYYNKKTMQFCPKCNFMVYTKLLKSDEGGEEAKSSTRTKILPSLPALSISKMRWQQHASGITSVASVLQRIMSWSRAPNLSIR